MEERNVARRARAGRGTFARFGGVASGLGGAVCVALLPKCPLCLAALLSAAGLGAGGAYFLAPLLRPAALGLLGLSSLWLAWIAGRAVGRRARGRLGSNLACCHAPPGERALRAG
jgi:hypothetical protein